MFNEAKKIQDALNKATMAINDFPTIAGVEAVNFYTENFRKQGFDDDHVEKWKPRKRERTRDNGRAILVKTGRLMRSFIKRKAGKLSVWIISNVPYASRQNEGGNGITPRQIIGESRKLSGRILDKLNIRIQRAFN